MAFPNKLIAYALGLSTSTIAGYIAAIGNKLGIRNRTQLVQTLAAFQGTPEQLNH